MSKLGGTSHPRETNPAQQVLRRIATHGPQSRTQLGNLLGLSPGSVTRVTKPLLDSGTAIEGTTLVDPISRRPSRLLDFPSNDSRFLGAKITATDIHIVVTNVRAIVQDRATVPLTTKSPSEIVNVIADALERFDTALPFTAIGITLGGHASNDSAHLVEAPFLDWYDVPLAHLIEERTGIPTTVENDVTALAEAQLWFGAGHDSDQFAVIAVGAGVGYALVLGDQVMTTTEGSLRQYSHHILDEGGPVCSLGHRGCAASLLTTGSITKAASLASEEPLSFQEVIERASQGDPVCHLIVNDAARALGMLVATTANMNLIETIVLAGEGIDIYHLGKTSFNSGLQKRRVPTEIQLDVRVLNADFDEWARGGAVVALQNHLARH